MTESAASGIEALEKNWDGPLAQNGGIEATFSFWKTLETTNPALSTNWRWQLLLLRAYYDTYTRRRLLYEQGLETKADAVLTQEVGSDPDKAMTDALAIVTKADTEPYPLN